MGHTVVTSVCVWRGDRGKRKKLEIQTTKDFICWNNWDLFCIHWKGADVL